MYACPAPRRPAPPAPRSHERCAVVRSPQERANAFFKRHGRRTCPTLQADEIAIAVHAAVRIPPFTPILLHYGDDYQCQRNYEVGEKCKELPMNECQKPCDAMPWRTWRLPSDASG